jgi:excisionase family DNA binding protein
MQAQLLTVREAALHLNLRESTVRAWVLRRRLAYVRVGRRAIRVPRSEIERIISEGTVPARDTRE